jgi:hypothetical protein
MENPEQHQPGAGLLWNRVSRWSKRGVIRRRLYRPRILAIPCRSHMVWRERPPIGRIGVSLACLALLVILPQIATANSPRAVHFTFTAPFYGGSTDQTTLGRLGCARAVNLPHPFFNHSTGSAGFNISSQASSCVKSGGNSSARILTNMLGKVMVPNRAGVTKVYANLSYAADLRASVLGGTCTSFSSVTYFGCQTYSDFNFSISGELLDKNSSYYYAARGGSPGVYWGLANVTYCDLGSCGGYLSGTGCNYVSGGCTYNSSNPYVLRLSGNISWVFSFGGSMPTGHRYQLLINIRGLTFDGTYCYNATLAASHSDSSINFSTGGDGFTLKSIVEV